MVMLYVLFYLTIIFNCICIIINKNSKLVSTCSLVAILIMMTGNSGNPDYFGYEFAYSNGGYSARIENGYVLLTSFFKNRGMTYQNYLFVFFLVSFLLIVFLVSRYDYFLHNFLLLYLSYIMFYDITQTRNLVAFVVFLFGVVAFLTNGYNIAYIVSVIVASLFHQSYIVLLIYAYIKPNKKFEKEMMKKIVFIIVALSVVTFLNGNRIPYIDIMVNKFLGAESYASSYFSTVTHFGFLKPLSCHIMNVIVACCSMQLVENYGDTVLSKRQKDFASVAYMMVLSSCFAIPLVMMNMNFTRYFRIVVIILFVMVDIVTMVILKNKGEKMYLYMGNKYKIDVYFYKIIVLTDVLMWSTLMLDSDLKDMVLSNNWIVR